MSIPIQATPCRHGYNYLPALRSSSSCGGGSGTGGGGNCPPPRGIKLRGDTSPWPNPAGGDLYIDSSQNPEILLKAKKFDLAISFFYDTKSTTLTEYGYGRSSNIRAYVSSSTSTGVVSLVRGNGIEVKFTKSGTAGGITTYAQVSGQGAASTLTFDGTKFTEYLPGGMLMDYQAQVGGGDPVKHEVIKVYDASGVAQTYTYGSGSEAGLLKYIDVQGGRRVTLNYIAGHSTSLLNTIEDWGGRFTTLQYDNRDYCTTMTTPLGCSTRYTYSLLSGGTSILSAITDPRGYATCYQYDVAKRVTVMSLGDAAFTFTYGDISVDPVTVMWPTGAITTYNPDSNGLITSEQTPDGVNTSYVYSNTRITQIQLPSGTPMSVTYDSVLGQIIASDDALGNRTTMQRDKYTNLTTLTDANGDISTFGYAGTGSTAQMIRKTDPLGRVTTYDYDGDGQLTVVTDPRGLKTTYSHDVYGNVVTIMNSDGTITSYAYDTLNRLTTVTDALGNTATMAYDAGDNVIGRTNTAGEYTQYIYNTCLLQAVVSPLGYRTTDTHGRFGHVLTHTDELGNITSNSYDNMGYIATVLDAAGNLTSTVYNSARQVIATVDGLGRATSYGYDTSARLQTITVPRGYVVTNVYNARDLNAVIDQLGKYTSYTLDNVGRRTAVQDALGNYASTTYDAAGQVSATQDQLGNLTSYLYDANSNLTTTTDALGRTNVNVYQTNSNRLAATLDGNGNATSFAYDLVGNITTTTDARGNNWLTAYDSAYRVISRTDPLSLVEKYGYDLDGRMVTMTDKRGNLTSMTYSKRSEVLTTVDPSGNTTSNIFDAIGRLSTRQLANGDLTSYSYDAASQQTGIKYADGTLVTNSYDANSNLTTMMDSTGTTTYAYDKANRVTGETDPGSLVQTYAYDAIGRRTTLTDPDSSVRVYVFDAASRLTVFVAPGGSRTSFAYDVADQQTTVLFGSGGKRHFAYDNAGQITSILDTASGGAQNSGFVLSYDPAGNRTTIVDHNGTTTVYSYDTANRLTKDVTTGLNTHSYDYTMDGNGNLLNWSESGGMVTATYAANDRIVTSLSAAGMTSLTHDTNGNLTVVQDPNGYTTMTYDNENRLTLHHSGGVYASYTYDAMSRKRSEVIAGTATTLIWEGWDYLQSRAASKINFYTVGGSILAQDTVGGARWDYLTDALGSVVATQDSTSAVGNTYRYKPYGAQLAKTGTSADPAFGWVGSQGYRPTGRVYSEEYVRARHFGSTQARWTTPDPLWPDELAYGYVGARPTELQDPEGTIAVPVYGNYCGPDWPKVPPKGVPWRPPTPIGDLDWCCKWHDDRYRLGKVKGSDEIGCQLDCQKSWPICLGHYRHPSPGCCLIHEYDGALSDCAARARCVPGKDARDCAFKRWAINHFMTYFCRGCPTTPDPIGATPPYGNGKKTLPIPPYW